MQNDFGTMIRLFFNAIAEDFESELSERGISFTELRFMRFAMVMGRPVRMRELEEYYGYAFPTVAGAVKSLERRGLVELLPDDGDRRVRLVRVTEEGVQAIEGLEDYRQSMESRLLGGLDGSDRDALRGLLERVYANIRGEQEERPIPRDVTDVQR